MPASPLTIAAGAIFGPVKGTAIVSASSTTAATVAFLIARYLARDRILATAQQNKRFAAIDRAISQNGFKFVALLRLSPLLPFSLSNYIYGLTSVDLGSYVLASWLGMLPGTYAYVSAGYVGRAVLLDAAGGGAAGGAASAAAGAGTPSWLLGVGVGASILAVGFIGQLAKRAIDEADAAAGADAGASGAGVQEAAAPARGKGERQK